ncbi:MinD superfamily P-loop ATPase [Salinibacter ruber]|uniref:ParA family protein n=1 Tax=Salinibacter ruber TaxID=146919 RepID=UPI000E576EE4|nr:ParA family protein [Salinibacter ruber]MCS3937242.1 MinD superfamily P-loop ATPase [Salinibacter ruber]
MTDGKILVHNHKGGTGKTMVSVHLAHHLARSAGPGGKPICVWDADTQGNAMSWISEHQWDGRESFRYTEDGQAPIVATIDPEVALGQNRLVVDTPPTGTFVEEFLSVARLTEEDVLLCPVDGRNAVSGALKVAEEVAPTGCRMIMVHNRADPKKSHARTEIEALEEIASHEDIGAELFRLAIPSNPDYMRRAEEQGIPVWDLSYASRTHTCKALRTFCSWVGNGAPPDDNPPAGGLGGNQKPISKSLNQRLWN